MKTPFPSSIVSTVRSFFSGGVIDVLWKAIVLAVVAGMVYLLAMLGTVGAIVAGIVVTSLLNDDIRALLADLWHRDFYEL